MSEVGLNVKQLREIDEINKNKERDSDIAQLKEKVLKQEMRNIADDRIRDYIFDHGTNLNKRNIVSSDNISDEEESAIILKRKKPKKKKKNY